MKKLRRRYPAETVTDTGNADDLMLFENSPYQTESLQRSQEQAAEDISISVNANRTEDTGIKQKNTISTLNGKPLKLVDHFTYLGSNISSSGSNITIRL